MNKLKNRRTIHLLFIVSLICLIFFFPKRIARASTLSAGSDIESRLIWFGDSRTVFFAKAVYGYKPARGVHPYVIMSKHVVARSSSMYGWAAGTGYKALEKRLKKRPDSIIIFNFGVNDIGRGYNHKKAYRKLLEKIHKKYPKALLCYMSVNPVKAGRRNPYARNAAKARKVNNKIRSFNSYIHKNLPPGALYINTYDHVSFSCIDGLHYTGKTYRDIAYFITGKRKLSQK